MMVPANTTACTCAIGVSTGFEPVHAENAL